MAEGENFDDELFADLYENDDEPAQPTASTATGQAQPPTDAPASAPTEVKNEASEDSKNNDAQNGEDSYMQGDEQYEDDDDDEVDFNIGGAMTVPKPEPEEEVVSLAYSAPAFNQQRAPPPAKGPNSKEDGKMFIGGLNWETTDDSLRDYFSQFGEVVECTVMRDGATGRSRGFGFLTFKDPKTVNIVMVKEHVLDGKIIDPKRAIPREEQEKTSKIFVGGVSQETTDHEFREYFAQFGRVVDATLMMDKDTGRPRGFGFVTFESEAGVDACLSANLEIHGKPIEVKKAQPRGNLREEEEAARRNGGKFGRKGPNQNGGGMGNGGMDDGAGAQGGAMAGMTGGAAGGMTPQLMAQYLQRMQQAMAMMQQSMIQNRQPMNPAMMQMMQMQQMQQMQQMMGRGGGNPTANMPPQMMAQMQQMQQQMMNQGGAGAGAMGPGGQGPQGANRPAYNAFEQQAFEQQKYDQQNRGGPRNNQQNCGNQGYGGGNMGGGGGPTSWEGMYDDVPQPNFPNQGGGGRGGFNNRRGGGQFQGQQPGPQDPNHAPPANAPTGPKNAGKPGANYRGGGRGQGRPGFHPYARG